MLNNFCRNAYHSLVNAVPQLLALTNPFNLPILTTNPLTSNITPIQHANSTSAISDLLKTPAEAPLLKHEDYPKVVYWNRRTWIQETNEKKVVSDCGISGSNQRGAVRAAAGINVRMRYVENEDGTVVDGFRASTIRKTAYKLFALFHSHGIAPTSWSKANFDVDRHFNREMALQIPEMRYCADNWKATYLAVQNYPSWYDSHVKSTKSMSIKVEAINTTPSDSDSAVTGEKRPHHGDSMQMGIRYEKKAKIQDSKESVVCELFAS